MLNLALTLRQQKIFFRFIVVFFTLNLSSCESLPSDSDGMTVTDAKTSTVINIEHRGDAKSHTASDNYMRLGAGYLAKNNYEKAMLKLQKSIALNSQNATAYSYMGVLFWRLDKPGLADENFKKSRQISPFNAAINHNYASFLCSIKRYDEASIVFDKVFSNPLYDRLSNAYQVSGDCDLAVTSLARAEKKYKKALKLEKTNTLAMLGMAKLYYIRENLKIAQYYFDRYERLSKHSPDSLWLGINIQRKLGDKNKLSSYILKLKNIYPDADETLMYIEGKEVY